jgi:site-specific DNA-methyltransferase (adenine-specific)
MLASIDHADEALKLADLAEAARIYALKAKLGTESVNYATSIKARALRRMAELVDAGQERGEIATRQDGTAIRDHVPSQDKVPATLTDLGISRQRLHEARKLEPLADEAIQEAVTEANTEGRQVSVSGLILRAAREIKSEQRVRRVQERTEQRAAVLETDHPLGGELYRVFVHDIREGAPDGPWPASAVITDPPYSATSAGLYQNLALAAQDVLKPGGSLLTMCGQANLDKFLAELGGCPVELKYQWTIGYFTPGQSTQVFGRCVKSNWKPVIWHVAGTYTGEHVEDTIRSDGNDKRFHKWGQSVSGMAALIERFTVPGDLVYDPFCGGGATGVAALLTGRLFVGSDIDEACVKQTAARLAEVSS